MVFSDRLECLCRQANLARLASESETITPKMRRTWNVRRVALEDSLRILEVPVERNDEGYITAFQIFEAWKEVRS